MPAEHILYTFCVNWRPLSMGHVLRYVKWSRGSFTKAKLECSHFESFFEKNPSVHADKMQSFA